MSEEQEEHITKAKSGDIIEFDGENSILQARVTSVLENSVVADLRYMKNFEKLGLERHNTVVNHKKYTIIEEG